MKSKNGLLIMVGDYQMDYKISVENRNRLIQYLREDFIERDNYGFGVHMDDFIVNTDNKVELIKDSLIIYKELVSMSTNNNWTINLTPRLTFFLKKIKHLKKMKYISSYEDLASELNEEILPEICLDQKIFYTNNINTEKYEYPMYKTVFSKLISNKENFFNNNYYFVHSFVRNEDDIEEMAEYNVSFDIIYNENNSETVANVKRISFKE